MTTKTDTLLKAMLLARKEGYLALKTYKDGSNRLDYQGKMLCFLFGFYIGNKVIILAQMYEFYNLNKL